VRLLGFLRRLNGPSGIVPAQPARLIDCGRCGCEFVNPVAWYEQDKTYWWIRLRCGQCGIAREVELSDDEAARLDRELDRGVADVARTLARIERDGPEALVAALRDL
jgi:hypothetical protein